MRLVYAEEEDFNGQAALWEANMERSIKGRKGQAALQRLEVALLALPEKKLAADVIEDKDGTVCALGALAKHENYQGSLALPGPPANTDDDEGWDAEGEERVEEAMLNLATELRVPKLVAMAIIHQNDNEYFPDRSLETRYKRVLGWTQRQLRKTQPDPTALRGGSESHKSGNDRS